MVRSGTGGLYVGRRKGDDLVYAAKVDHGFDKISAADLKERLKPRVSRESGQGKVSSQGLREDL
jgi:bifunctional non-homologous end joining protein LigD